MLSVEADELDALRFLALSHEGREALARGDAETAAEALREALALWRGPVLGGEPTGPAEPAARRSRACAQRRRPHSSRRSRRSPARAIWPPRSLPLPESR